MKASHFFPRHALVALLFLAACLYFVGLDNSSLWDSNEAFYAETPREMLEAGDWVNPTFNYQPRFNKPPLSYWVVAVCYKLFGVSEAAERLPIALGAIALIATAFALGRVVYSTDAGLLAALALATTPRFLMFSRRIIIDVYLAMFMGLALLMFVLAQHRPERRRVFLSLMYVCIGLGILTKGPVAVLLPGLAFVIYLAYCRRLGAAKEMMLPWGLLIVTALVLPWYAVIYAHHGPGHIVRFLLEDNISRFTEPVWGPRRGVLFYLPVVLGDLFPWSILLVGASVSGLVRTVRRGRQVTGGSILWIWIVVIVLFFSLSSNKEDLYILPIFPAAAAVVGGEITRRDSASRSPTSLWLGLAGAALSIAGGLVVYAINGPLERYRLAGASVIGVVALAGGLASVFLAKRRLWPMLTLASSLVVINSTFVSVTLSDFERFKPVKGLSAVIANRAGPGAMVGYYRFASPSMVYYLRSPVFEYYRPEELIAALKSGSEVYCLMTAGDYEAIKELLPAPTSVLATRPVFQVKLRRVFTRSDENPQVVLISNMLGAGNPE